MLPDKAGKLSLLVAEVQGKLLRSFSLQPNNCCYTSTPTQTTIPKCAIHPAANRGRLCLNVALLRYNSHGNFAQHFAFHKLNFINEQFGVTNKIIPKVSRKRINANKQMLLQHTPNDIGSRVLQCSLLTSSTVIISTTHRELPKRHSATF